MQLVGRSWEDQASDYNIRQGGLLPIRMAVLALSPVMASCLRRLTGRHVIL
jgi:hypothetical protein